MTASKTQPALLGGALRARDPESLLRLGLFLIAGFASILIHELGHALMVRRFKGACSITLQAFGGFVAHRIPRTERLRSFLITASGPALQIAAGVAVYAAWDHLPLGRPMFGYFLEILWKISIVWAMIMAVGVNSQPSPPSGPERESARNTISPATTGGSPISPLTSTNPLSAGRMPLRASIRVDLPAPDGPISTVKSRLSTSSITSCKA